MDINICVLGCGRWGRNLIREFYNLNVLKSIYDKNSDLLNHYKNLYPDVEITNNWNNILNNELINAVIISLPSELHFQYALDSLNANKDVFIEKPMTLNIDDAETLCKLALHKNKILMVGHILHYHPCIQKIKELINENKIGKIKNIISNRFNFGRFRSEENVLWSFAPHDISLILSLCNRLPDRISCHGRDLLKKNIHDITNTILEWNNNGITDIYVNINVNWLNPFKEQKMSIIGDSGMIVFDDTQTNKLLLYENYLNNDSNVPTIIDYNKNTTPLIEECKYFIDCCINRKTPLTDGFEGLQVLKVLTASTDSLNKNGLTINMNDLFQEQKYFIHETSIIDNKNISIGKNTKIWHFCHITNDAVIGENCNIGQNCYIAGKLGNFCKVQNNVSIYKGVECGDYVFFGPSCVLTNDKTPRCISSKNGNYMKTIIEDHVTIGANSTILCGIKIGQGAFIGAGSVVTKDVLPFHIVVGNPAKSIGIDDIKNNLSN